MDKYQNEHAIEPWFKQGWPWALIAIPFLTVVAGVITIFIAADTDDSLVQDDYYKKGLAINSNLERTQQALTDNMKAVVHFDQASNLLFLQLDSKQPLPDTVSLTLSHPTLDQKDRIFELARLAGNEYAVEVKAIEAAYWHLSIEDHTQRWLLKSRWLYPDIKQVKIDPQNQNN
jgi:hypothetical protein